MISKWSDVHMATTEVTSRHKHHANEAAQCKNMVKLEQMLKPLVETH